MENKSKHPCFNKEAKGKFARVHLPVAPKCNIQCNYCNRKYDCVNESRPGVTSSVLSPHQAKAYVDVLSQKLDNISVYGIAGPGDPLANPGETFETIWLIKAAHPEAIFCLSTNGLALNEYIDTIASLGIGYVTLTINGVDPTITGKIYAWARHDKKVYQGQKAAEVILENQLKAIPRLKEKGIIVKINTIVIPGVNEHHIEDVAKTVAALGADTMNAIPLFPVEETAFGHLNEPNSLQMVVLRKSIANYIEPMTHCARCRADAAGLLGQDLPDTATLITEMARLPLQMDGNRTRTAVGTFEGMLVNRHLGDADILYIFEETRNGYKLVDRRPTPTPGGGDERWRELAKTLHDCKALLVSGAGPSPVRVLTDAGIRVIQMTGLIDEGLDHLYKQKVLKTVSKAEMFRCGQGCSGKAIGCA